jgi:hypothetical protein
MGGRMMFHPTSRSDKGLLGLGGRWNVPLKSFCKSRITNTGFCRWAGKISRMKITIKKLI